MTKRAENQKPMASHDRMSELPSEQRNELEQLLMEFDQAWTPERLPEYLDRASNEPDESMRRLAVGELTRIDMQRRWSTKHGLLLEQYLERAPVLGTVDTVDAELILVEYLARRAAYPAVNLDGYAARFPSQYDRVVQLAAKAGESVAAPADRHAAQASIETSRAPSAHDTGASQPGPAQDLPSQFGRYRILRTLGAGAMGTVFLAHDSQLDRQVAIKTPSFQGGKDDELVARFYREARAAAKIQHRNICPIYDVGEILGRHFISMGFIKGRSMADYITPDQPPPPKTSAVLVHRIASALAEAHRHNVVHRDLKPANIMIDTKREPVVMDFGLARETDTESRMTQSGMLVGTPAYMSPEQVLGDSRLVGPASDIYALGVILYELLTGKLPFRGSIVHVVHQITSAEPVPPSEIRDGVDAELEAICAKMMAKQQTERFASMEDVAAALKRYLKGKKKERPTPAPNRDKKDLVAARVTATEPAAEVNETAALNAFFAGQNKAVPQQTQVELDLSRMAPTPASTRQSGSVEATSTKRAVSSRRPFLRAVPWIAAVATAAIVSLGLVVLFKTPAGTLRIETVGELDGLEVLVDDESIRLNSEKKIGANEHELALLLNGTRLSLDPAANQFVFAQHGNEQRLSVSIGGVQLTSQQFTIARNEVAVLKIQLVPSTAQTADTSPPVRTSGPRLSAPDLPADSPDFVAGSTQNDWHVLFDGSGTTAWQDLGPFRVENGLLVADQPGYAVSRSTFSDFEMQFEWRIGSGGNSGVYYRVFADAMRGKAQYAATEFQLLDNAGHRNGNNPKTSCGALYGMIPAPRNVANPPGDWNTSRIVARSRNVQHWINGQQILAYEIGNAVWQRALSELNNKHEQELRRNVASFGGHVALQGHTGEIAFRKIRIRKLNNSLEGEATKNPANNAQRFSPREAEANRRRSAFVSLFDGKDLTQWSAIGHDGWSIDGEVLVGQTRKKAGWLMSQQKYRDFELELDYQLGRGANSGIFLRAWPQGNVNGADFHEVQLLDEHAEKFSQVSADKRTGSLYNQLAADPALRPAPNQWHQLSIRLAGNQLRVSINGRQVLNGRIPSGKPDEGHIGLQLYPTKVQFRNIRIRNLNDPLRRTTRHQLRAPGIRPPARWPAKLSGSCQQDHEEFTLTI